MKSKAVKTCCKQGFTLIELLVVVLIIGILAAVALPQYNKAVKKAQGREVLVALDAMDKAFQAYMLENGQLYKPLAGGAQGSLHLEDFSVSIPTLKYWQYLVGICGSEYSSTFPCFRGGIGSGVAIKSNTSNAVVNVGFNAQGQRTYLYCAGSDCGAYFNCTWEEREGCGGNCNSTVCLFSN